MKIVGTLFQAEKRGHLFYFSSDKVLNWTCHSINKINDQTQLRAHPAMN